MRVLIVGEFSGFAKHLKKGFEKLGHEVMIVMTPDSFKKIKGGRGDIIYGQNISLFGRPVKGSALALLPFRSIRVRWSLWRRYCLRRPDLIVVINGDFLTTSFARLGTPLSFIEKQLQKGAKVILTECGRSPAGFYSHQDFWTQRGKVLRLEDSRYSFLLEHCHKIVPTAYSYWLDLMLYANYHYYDVSKVNRAIPLPITIEDKIVIKPCVGRKIIIFHGITRPEFKGTQFILKAMNRLKEEMPERVECISRGGMPYDEYVRLFDRIDILVDQTYGNGWGMNAIMGAMKGKCVLTPCGKENAENMGIPDIPFIKISPDSEQIYASLKELVSAPERIDALKEACRHFAETYCRSDLIAQRYFDAVGL